MLLVFIHSLRSNNKSTCAVTVKIHNPQYAPCQVNVNSGCFKHLNWWQTQLFLWGGQSPEKTAPPARSVITNLVFPFTTCRCCHWHMFLHRYQIITELRPMQLQIPTDVHVLLKWTVALRLRQTLPTLKSSSRNFDPISMLPLSLSLSLLLSRPLVLHKIHWYSHEARHQWQSLYEQRGMRRTREKGNDREVKERETWQTWIKGKRNVRNENEREQARACVCVCVSFYGCIEKYSSIPSLWGHFFWSSHLWKSCLRVDAWFQGSGQNQV